MSFYGGAVNAAALWKDRTGLIKWLPFPVDFDVLMAP